MTTVNKNEDDGDMRTDARPSPPREQKDIPRQPPVEDDFKDIQEDIEEFPPVYKINHKKKQKTRKIQSPIASVINISNANGIQIGTNITYNIQRKEPKDIGKKHYHKSEQITKLLNCQERVTEDDLLFVSTHVGEGWRHIGRKLKYSEGQIYQFEESHRLKGVKEVVYQLLLDWIQNEPETATLGKLNTVLWETQQEEVVTLLSEKLTL